MLSEEHWVTTRFLDMNRDFCEQLGYLDEALAHCDSQLRFLDRHVQHPSLRRAGLREKKAILLEGLDRRLEAAKSSMLGSRRLAQCDQRATRSISLTQRRD